MQKRKADSMLATMDDVKSGTIDAACVRYGYGRATMRKLAEQAEAIIRIGRTVRVNYSKVDRYIDTISE